MVLELDFPNQKHDYFTKLINAILNSNLIDFLGHQIILLLLFGQSLIVIIQFLEQQFLTLANSHDHNLLLELIKLNQIHYLKVLPAIGK